MYETLRVDREDHLTWLTLNRPDALNALDPVMVRELRQLLWNLPEDHQTRVLVMRGAGRAFCAGLDLKAHASSPSVGGGVPAGLRVSRVVPDDELEAAARAMAQDMLRNAPLALRLTKECYRHALDAGSLEAVIAMEDRNQVLAAGTADFREGVAAFLQKRPARFEDA